MRMPPYFMYRATTGQFTRLPAGFDAQLFEQHRDEVQTRLDREDLIRGDVARQAQRRVPIGRRPHAAVGRDHVAGHVVRLQADQMTQAVRDECVGDARLECFGAGTIDQFELCQQITNGAMHRLVELEIVQRPA